MMFVLVRLAAVAAAGPGPGRAGRRRDLDRDDALGIGALGHGMDVVGD